MHALARSGDRAGAIRHKVHAALLRGELEEEPDPAVMLLAERLTQQPVEVTPTPASSSKPSTSGEPPPRSADASIVRRSKPLGLLPPGAGESTIREWSLLRWSSDALRRARGERARAGCNRAADVDRRRVGTLPLSGSKAAHGGAGRDRKFGQRVGACRARSDARAARADAGARRGKRRGDEPGVAVDETLNDRASHRRSGGRCRASSRNSTGRGWTCAPVGPGAQILLRLVDAERGETLASASEWARASADIVPAVARLADQLRARATESPLSESELCRR